MTRGKPSTTCGDHGGRKTNGEPCGRSEGWGTDFEDGKCSFHRGTDSDGSSHEDNQNAATHGLFSSHDGYYHDLDDDEQEWVFDFTNDLLDRHRRAHGQDPDMFDKEALKNIAIDFHRVAHANGYFRDKGLVQTNWETTDQGDKVPRGDEINVWAKEIRQYNESVYNRMKKHGLLEDPESAKAESMESLAVILSED